MIDDEKSDIQWGDIGGLNEQIREIREVIELPLTNPELFVRVGIKAPKVRKAKSSFSHSHIHISPPSLSIYIYYIYK